MKEKKIKSPIEKLSNTLFTEKKIEFYILREDLIHSTISGNKWRKLKYNVLEAKAKGFNTILTFGGAYSNHIAATAAAGKEFGLKTIGIIRGDEVKNLTLDLAVENGMELKFVSREVYREKDASQYSNCYVIPEGGSNALAVKGCAEIVDSIDVDFDVICCACGTGGTIAGIISSTDKKVLGFPALKGGNFLVEDIERLLDDSNVKERTTNWQLITDYHFGGYAKVKPELIDFLRTFKKENNILLDFIYTGKMLFGLYDMIENTNQLNGKKIVVVHTGGIQGNKGFEERFNIVL